MLKQMSLRIIIAPIFGVTLILSTFISVDTVAAQDVLAKAAYLNTAYCSGAVDKYAERLAAANGSTHRTQARQAQRYAMSLKENAERLRVRYDYKPSDGVAASANGSRTMAGLLPRGRSMGQWRRRTN